MLEEKYAGSFRQSATVSKIDAGLRIAANSVPDAMTKPELIKLWNQTGDKIHRLKISKFFRSYEVSDASNEIGEIELIVKKLHLLLDIHIVPMHNPKTLVLVTLFGEDGHPSASFLEYDANERLTVRPFSAKGTTDFFRE